ncbi:uncharacterized protein HMPREF1541_03967 [Cyphellophora europaea CBS 101466]|uniref:Zn(2)-C6 fungal-type domain-containing protein n=1 Tax=Cyphellophora europaea (strain CBS 101466) TaxID=1220924 RepID=W2S1V6_CYPE1|nr:uncharacterized protein HMPREF1541_03967 [Cyphellophora europaea CBS 101466]ETN42028.1 hypothetical protein HMPREF1541_03967 [Cyphellophora europaea CBS 101466]
MGLTSSSSRSRHGCKTCKIRRVKCDETRPSCNKCVQTGRKCDGPLTERIIINYGHQHVNAPTSVTNQSLTTTNPVHKPFTNPDEARAFEYFVHRAAPALAGSLDSYFWMTLLPRLSQSSQAIRKVVLAISTLYEHPLTDAYRSDGIHYSTWQHRAMTWYRESLSLALQPQTAIDEKQQLEFSMLSCLLFASVEIQHANVQTTLTLLRQGYRLIERYLTLQTLTSSRSPVWIEDIVLPFLVRQAVLFTIFGHVLPSGFFAIVDRLVSTNQTVIHSIADARTAIYSIIFRVFNLVQDATVSNIGDIVIRNNVAERQHSLMEQLCQWHSEIDRFMAETARSSTEQATCHTLICNQGVACIWLGRVLDTPGVNPSIEDGMFHEILLHAERALDCLARASDEPGVIPFVFESGTAAPLFFVGWQCRSRDLRRQTLALMKRLPLQESLFVKELQIIAMKKIIALEEGFSTKHFDEAEKARLPHVSHSMPLNQVVCKYRIFLAFPRFCN